MTDAPPDNIALFPGVRREKLPDMAPAPTAETDPTPDPALTSEMVMRAAIESGVRDVVLAGLLSDGSIYIAHETPDQDAAAGKLLRAANFLTAVDYEDDFDEEED